MEQPLNINVSLDQTVEVHCEECSCTYFQQSLYIRKVPGIISGSPNPSYVPIPVFSCIKCGHVNQEFLPKEVKSLD